jgi:glycosyltransferase involved in cell wall biosynthesis
MKISFGLVVYNEEALIGRCLDSIKDVADEILIVHDGECTDKTLEIAQKYTNQVFVREHLGGSEPHRIFLLENARNDWVFMIDADEFLSDKLKAFIKNDFINQEECQTAAFKWPFWDGKKYVTHNNYRPCLFDRNKCWAIALHNFSIQTTGKICKFDYILEHQPKEGKIGLQLFQTKLLIRIERDAKTFARGYEALNKYNEKLIPVSFKKWFNNYLKHPIFFAYYNLIKHFFGAYKYLYKNGKKGFIVSLQLGLYQYKLAWKVWKMNRKLKSR